MTMFFHSNRDDRLCMMNSQLLDLSSISQRVVLLSIAKTIFFRYSPAKRTFIFYAFLDLFIELHKKILVISNADSFLLT